VAEEVSAALQMPDEAMRLVLGGDAMRRMPIERIEGAKSMMRDLPRNAPQARPANP
jgi:hypothetical protein